MPPTSQRRCLKILILEAGGLLWAWSMDDPLTQIPRLSTFWPIAALHRLLARVTNVRTCLSGPFQWHRFQRASRKIHLSFASCKRDARMRRGTKEQERAQRLVFHRRWIGTRENTSWLHYHRLRPYEKARVSSWERTNESHTDLFLSHSTGDRGKVFDRYILSLFLSVSLSLSKRACNVNVYAFKQNYIRNAAFSLDLNECEMYWEWECIEWKNIVINLISISIWNFNLNKLYW